MATTKKITMKQFNGTDYDTLYPKTVANQVDGVFPIASGGTGGTTAPTALSNLLNGLSTITPVKNDLFPFKDISGNTSGLVTLANLIAVMGNNGVITTSNLDTQTANLGYVKIQTGSYVGTGTYGSSNPCSLTFNFAPKILIIYCEDYNRYYATQDYRLDKSYFIAIYGSPIYTCVYGNNEDIAKITGWGTNTLQWYSSSGATTQFNSSSSNGHTYTYRFFACG